MSDGLDDIELPEAAIVRPIRLWTCKQVMSLLIRPNRKCRVLVNFDLNLKDRNYTSQQSMCHKDGYVVFRNSELLSGNLAKKTLGDGSKKGLFMFDSRSRCRRGSAMYEPPRKALCKMAR